MISVDQILYDDIWYAKLIYRTWCPHFLFIALSELTHYVCLMFDITVTYWICVTSKHAVISMFTTFNNIKHT